MKNGNGGFDATRLRRVRNDFRRGPPPRCRRGDYSGDEPSTRHSTARQRAQLVETPVKVAIEGSCISPIRATNETALVALIGELHVFIHQISRCVFPGSSPVPRLSKPSEWEPRARSTSGSHCASACLRQLGFASADMPASRVGTPAYSFFWGNDPGCIMSVLTREVSRSMPPRRGRVWSRRVLPFRMLQILATPHKPLGQSASCAETRSIYLG